MSGGRRPPLAATWPAPVGTGHPPTYIYCGKICLFVGGQPLTELLPGPGQGAGWLRNIKSENSSHCTLCTLPCANSPLRFHCSRRVTPPGCDVVTWKCFREAVVAPSSSSSIPQKQPGFILLVSGTTSLSTLTFLRFSNYAKCYNQKEKLLNILSLWHDGMNVFDQFNRRHLKSIHENDDIQEKHCFQHTQLHMNNIQLKKCPLFTFHIGNHQSWLTGWKFPVANRCGYFGLSTKTSSFMDRYICSFSRSLNYANSLNSSVLCSR